MSEGNMSRSQNVGRTASRTRRRGSDATAALPTHGDADVACSLYVYSHCSCCEAVQVLMIVNELSCRSQWHRRDAWHLPLSNQMAAAPLVDLGGPPGPLKNEPRRSTVWALQVQDSAATEVEPARRKAVSVKVELRCIVAEKAHKLNERTCILLNDVCVLVSCFLHLR